MSTSKQKNVRQGKSFRSVCNKWNGMCRWSGRRETWTGPVLGMTGDVRERVTTPGWKAAVWLFLWGCWHTAVNPWPGGSGAPPGLRACWGRQLSLSLCLLHFVWLVSFPFKIHRPELMEYFSTETTHFTVCTRCFPCLYNLQLSALPVLNMYLLTIVLWAVATERLEKPGI